MPQTPPQSLSLFSHFTGTRKPTFIRCCLSLVVVRRNPRWNSELIQSKPFGTGNVKRINGTRTELREEEKKRRRYENAIENQADLGRQRSARAGDPFPICGWLGRKLHPTRAGDCGKHLARYQRGPSVRAPEDRDRRRLFEVCLCVLSNQSHRLRF